MDIPVWQYHLYMYTKKNIFINTENKQTNNNNNKKYTISTTLDEGDKEGESGGGGGEMGVLVGVFVNTVYSYPYPCSYSVIHTEP